MAKTPSFPFYASDYLTGTMAMTPTERGCYVDLLCYQWATGSVPGDDIKRLAGAMRCSPAEARRVWRTLAPKFPQQPDGRYQNPRLEDVRAEKRRYHEAQRRNGQMGGRRRKSETHGEPTGLPNESQIEPTGSPIGAESENPRVPSGNRSSLSLSSVPTGTGRATRDPFGFRQARNITTFIVGAGGQVIDVPESWAHRVCREFGLTLDDVDAFVAWAGAWVGRSGYDPPNGDKFRWLDARLAEWRTARTASATADTAVEATQRLLRAEDERRAAILRERAGA